MRSSARRRAAAPPLSSPLRGPHVPRRALRRTPSHNVDGPREAIAVLGCSHGIGRVLAGADKLSVDLVCLERVEDKAQVHTDVTRPCGEVATLQL